MGWGLGFLRTRRGARQAKARGGVFRRGSSTKFARWTDVPIDRIPLVPGMTHEDELKYFYWCSATLHRPGNRVVELGPYVGRSTMALAAGMRDSDDARGKVITVDRFEWEPYMLKITKGYTIGGLSESQRARLTPDQLEPRLGDCYLPIFELYTEPMKDWIEPVQTVLETCRWRGDPIDVLMIDAAKTWDAFDQIIREFFTHLVDGAAVIHQDYKHAITYWLHPVTERMLERGVLTVAENIPAMPTQGFRFRRKGKFNPAEFVQEAYSEVELDRLMDCSVGRFRSELDRIPVMAAKCLMLKERGQLDRAKATFEKAISEGGFADDFPLDDLLMIGSGWHRPLSPTLLATAVARVAGQGDVGLAVEQDGNRSISIPAVVRGNSVVVEAPNIHIDGAKAMALNFRADTTGDEALRIRVQAMAGGTGEPFYDEKFRVLPGDYQPVVVPLVGRSRVSLRMTMATERSATADRRLKCIVPMLFER